MIGHHPYHLHRLKFTELSEIYTSETIKTFAYSLIGIFVPIYLLKNGVTLQTLCVMFILHSIFRLVLEYPVGRAIARYGAKHILAISYPFSFIYIVMLAVYPTYPTPLYLIAGLWALADSMHWVAYHSVFSKAKTKARSGRQISFIGILSVAAGALAPIIGGIIAVRYGLQSVFLLAPVLLLVAMLPLFQSMETVRSKRLRFGGLARTIRGDMLSHAGLGFDVIVGTVVWPLFIYFVVNDYLKLGMIISLSFLLSIAALLAIGRVSDVVSKKKLIIAGSSGLALVNISRNLAGTFWYAFGINIFATIIGPLLSTPLFSIFYAHADRTRRIEYTVLMEMAGDAARIVAWTALLLVSLYASQQTVFRAAFLMAAIALIATNAVQVKLHRKHARLLPFKA